MRTEGTQTELQQVQHSGNSHSSWESRGVLHYTHEGEDLSQDKMYDKEVGDWDSSPHLGGACSLCCLVGPV